MHFLSIFLLQFLFEFGISCSQPFASHQSISERANKSKIFVYAQVLRTYNATTAILAMQGSSVYTAEFRLLCPLNTDDHYFHKLESLAQSRGSHHPDEIVFNVTEMGFAHGLCYNNSVTVEKNYFMFLQESSASSEPEQPYFLQLDPINGQKALFKDTKATRSAVTAFTSDCFQRSNGLLPDRKTDQIDPNASLEPGLSSEHESPPTQKPNSYFPTPGDATEHQQTVPETETTTSDCFVLTSNCFVALFAFTSIILNV